MLYKILCLLFILCLVKSSIAPLYVTRQDATQLQNGDVFITGGASYEEPDYNLCMILLTGGIRNNLRGLNKSDPYDSSSNTWISVPDMPHPHCWHTVTVLKSGKVLVVGGG
ncbi:unnamed protein product [Adineta ricciae]|uniref:Uncharacterized protein n=1 Tax=Adineta ricciae TaxID=249248 RepID=A0A815WM44_ADIRI|nr:unnamed protein product [Adineta ricciae]